MGTIKCPKCNAEIQLEGVQDIVLTWSDNVFTDERQMIASVTPDGALILGLTNQHGKRVMVNVQLGVPMPQQRGEPKAFQLIQIYPGVLKLTPSVFDPALHAYVTIVGAPVAQAPEELGNKS